MITAAGAAAGSGNDDGSSKRNGKGEGEGLEERCCDNWWCWWGGFDGFIVVIFVSAEWAVDDFAQVKGGDWFRCEIGLGCFIRIGGGTCAAPRGIQLGSTVLLV